MQDLEKSIVNWVFFTKINKSQASHKCTSLNELNDGILLFELMTQMY